jgi:hypothetical protein
VRSAAPESTIKRSSTSKKAFLQKGSNLSLLFIEFSKFGVTRGRAFSFSGFLGSSAIFFSVPFARM